MIKYLAVILCILSVSGCATNKITANTVKVRVPVLYAPPPPVLIRPDLAIHELPNNARNDYALIAKHYKITVIQLLNYIEQLELVMNDYQLISETLDKSGAIINDGIDITID